MICAYCKSDIDNDSFHCDQCGKELFICTVCGKPGKGKACVDDGGALFSPRQKASGGAPAIAPAAQNISPFSQPATPSPAFQPQPAPQPAFQPQPIPQPAFQPQTVQQPAFQPQSISQPFISPLPSSDPSAIPALKLINNHLKIDIDIKDGTIIGRSNGDFVSIFSQFSQVSGRHMQFLFDKNNGWMIKDLGSTNGVAMSTQPNWQSAARLNANVPVAIQNNTFLLIANIEFQIKVILPPSPAQGTKRI